MDTFTEVYPQLKENVMTALRQLRKVALKEGEERGLQKGMQQGMQQVAKSMFAQLHLDIETIKNVTGLSQETLERLQREVTRKG